MTQEEVKGVYEDLPGVIKYIQMSGYLIQASNHLTA